MLSIKVNEDKAMNFVIYCIEILKDIFHTSGSDIYRVLRKHGLIELIYDNYEDLHSMGRIYLINYIVDILRNRGEQI